jgi:hypothetical protein
MVRILFQTGGACHVSSLGFPETSGIRTGSRAITIIAAFKVGQGLDHDPRNYLRSYVIVQKELTGWP